MPNMNPNKTAMPVQDPKERARNFEEAILWHFGEAEFARELFRNLTQRERGELIDFLKSL